MPSNSTLILIAVLLWVTGALAVLAFLKVANAKPTPPAPPKEPSINVISRNISQAIKEAVVETNASTAKAMGEALQAAFASPPSAERDEVLERVQHELAAWAAEADVDDTDPIGDAIMPRDRDDAVFVDPDDPAPMGIPGLRFPMPTGD